MLPTKMLSAYRLQRANATAHVESMYYKSLSYSVMAPKWRMARVASRDYGRIWTVMYSAKQKKEDNMYSYDATGRPALGTELQAYADRERFLISELAAARAQADKMLDHQRLLLEMVARLSGLDTSSVQLQSAWESPTAPSPLPPPPQPFPSSSPPQRSAASPEATAAPARSQMVHSSATSSSSDVPALTSLADLFKSAATSHPSSAVAASSIAAAISAVDNGDILTINNFDIPSPALAAQRLSLPQPSLMFDTMGGFTAGTASPAQPVSATVAAEAAEADLPVEVPKAPPTGPPPELVQGDDDIYWLSRLHSCLESKGYYPGDDDMESWFFGEGTMSALLAFQATEHLPETGVVDRPTWTALLGKEVAEELYGRAAAATVAAASETPRSDPPSTLSSPSPPSPVAAAAPSSVRTSTAPMEAAAHLTKWPVLMEGDGGREVHALQVGLENNGFSCGDDDLRWWQFGEGTLNSLKYFQSCNSLPESGVCDERVWRRLMGEEAAPADLYQLRMAANSDDEDGGFDEDMDAISEGRVWLLGEQRWERRRQ